MRGWLISVARQGLPGGKDPTLSLCFSQEAQPEKFCEHWSVGRTHPSFQVSRNRGKASSLTGDRAKMPGTQCAQCTKQKSLQIEARHLYTGLQISLTEIAQF